MRVKRRVFPKHKRYRLRTRINGYVRHQYTTFYPSKKQKSIPKIVPTQPKPMEAIPTKGHIYEPKYDGTRVLLYLDKQLGQAMINRRNVNQTAQFPELSTLHKKLRYKDSAIIDGEIYVPNENDPYGNFKKLSMRSHLKDKDKIRRRAKTMPAKMIAFDILEKDGKILTTKPLGERKKILDRVIPDKLKKIDEVETSKDIKKLVKKVKQVDGEGVVAKSLKSKYEAGKDTKHWKKAKFTRINDVVILGYTEGTGKRKGLFGAIIGGVWNGKTYQRIGKIGTGFSDKELRRLKTKMDSVKTRKENNTVWLKPKLIARVKFARRTPKGIYREPRYISERVDIKPEQTHPTKLRLIKFSKKPELIKVEKKSKMITTRHPKEVLNLAKRLKKILQPHSKKIELVGSIRRKKEKAISDIDIVMIPKDRMIVRDLLAKKGHIISSGDKKIESTIQGVKVDVFYTDKKSYPAALLFATGPAGGNISNRALAKEKGMKLNQYGLFDRKTGKRIPTKTEKDIYEKLGKTYRSPEMRGLPR